MPSGVGVAWAGGGVTGVGVAGITGSVITGVGVAGAACMVVILSTKVIAVSQPGSRFEETFSQFIAWFESKVACTALPKQPGPAW